MIYDYKPWEIARYVVRHVRVKSPVLRSQLLPPMCNYTEGRSCRFEKIDFGETKTTSIVAAKKHRQTFLRSHFRNTFVGPQL
jgi:hypothetical protein